MTDTETPSISAGAFATSVGEMIMEATQDPRLAIAIAEGVLCKIVAACMKTESVPKWMERFSRMAPTLIAELRLAQEDEGTMQ